MRVQTYVVQVRDARGRPIMLGSENAVVAQPALWGANESHGPTVFTDVEEGLMFCVNMQRSVPNHTYHLIPANEVEVRVVREVTIPPMGSHQAAQRDRQAQAANALTRLAFGHDA